MFKSKVFAKTFAKQLVLQKKTANIRKYYYVIFLSLNNPPLPRSEFALILFLLEFPEVLNTLRGGGQFPRNGTAPYIRPPNES